MNIEISHSPCISSTHSNGQTFALATRIILSLYYLIQGINEFSLTTLRKICLEESEKTLLRRWQDLGQVWKGAEESISDK